MFIVLINHSLSKFIGICPISNISVSIDAVSGENLTETGQSGPYEEAICQTCPLGHHRHHRTDGLTCQWGLRPTAPGGDAVSGLSVLPGTMSRNGPGWRWARGGEKETAPSPLWHSSPCPRKELQATEVSYQTCLNNLRCLSCK